ncbi:MAG: hypothetical protein IJO74_00500 [Clostridia bacterium]|nr:hypothetical protein [Clostridia bacterium]
MSGIKDVQIRITRSQRDQLITATRQALETAQQLQQRAELRQSAQELSDASISLITNLLQQQVNDLHDEVRTMAETQNRRLTNLANDYAQSIEDLRKQRERDRAELQMNLNALKERDQNHREQAQFWINQAEAFFADIEQYRHDMFTPNQLARLRGHIAQVQQDMQSEAYQSAIASARSIFNQAVDLKERVVQAEIEWAHYHTQFQQAFADLRSELYYHQTMQFIINTEAGEEHIDANIDYWSNGSLSSIAEAIEQMTEIMERINDVPTTELIAMLERIKEQRSLLDKARENAKDALISSQMRAEMASTMAEHLQMAGWEFVGYTYEGSELNAALHVKFRDNMGNEIVTVISPQNHQGELCNNMQVNFFDPYNNDESMRGIWVDGILERLREAGLNVGRPITKPGFEIRQSDNEAVRDLEATASRRNK